MKLLSRVWLFATPWTVAYQASPSMGFSRQEYWSGSRFPSPGDLPDPGMEPRYRVFQADTLTSEPPGKPFKGLVPLLLLKEKGKKKKKNPVARFYQKTTRAVVWRDNVLQISKMQICNWSDGLLLIYCTWFWVSAVSIVSSLTKKCFHDLYRWYQNWINSSLNNKICGWLH